MFLQLQDILDIPKLTKGSNEKLLMAALSLAAITPAPVLAEAGNWVIRVRAAHISPNEHSELGKTVNANIAPVMNSGAELGVKNNTIPELDISYCFTKKIAVELIFSLRYAT